MQWITKTEPMDHQFRALEACKGREYFAYFMEPGLGKTKVVIDEAANLALAGALYRVVVICPKSIMSTWAEEIATHGAVPADVMVWDTAKFQVIQHDKNAVIQWWIINIDSVNRPKTDKGVIDKGFRAVYDAIRHSRGSMLVVDESTIIKNVDAKRTKAVMELGALAEYRRILTGTPVANTPLDIFAQMKFLHPTAIFKSNFFAFRAKYAIMGGYQFRQVVGYKNQEQLAEIVAKHSFRATKAECLDLPPRTTQVREVTLTDTSWKIYRALVDELAIEIANTEMSIDMVIKKITKLRQLTGGWIRDDVGEAHAVGTEKLSELKHLLDECMGQKIIIWCQFVHEIHALQKLHPKARVYHGGMTPAARDEARHAFEKGDCPIIIIQNDTGSVGLTLNAASVSIFYSNPIYALNKQQARERNHRKGQDKPVTEYELIVKGSIDESIYNTLVNKTSLGNAIMAATERGDKIKALKDFLMPMKKVNWKSPTKGHHDPLA